MNGMNDYDCTLLSLHTVSNLLSKSSSFCGETRPVSVFWFFLSVTSLHHCDKVLLQNWSIFFLFTFVLILRTLLWNSSVQNAKAPLCHLTWTMTEGQHYKEIKRMPPCSSVTSDAIWNTWRKHCVLQKHWDHCVVPFWVEFLCSPRACVGFLP